MLACLCLRVAYVCDCGSTSGGTVSNGCLTCPFHGWQFRGDGTCASIPYSDARPPDYAKVSSYTVKEVNRMVVLWFDAEGRPPMWQVPEVPMVAAASTAVLIANAVHFVSAHIQVSDARV